jgi:hypothetical protein
MWSSVGSGSGSGCWLWCTCTATIYKVWQSSKSHDWPAEAILLPSSQCSHWNTKRQLQCSALQHSYQVSMHLSASATGQYPGTTGATWMPRGKCLPVGCASKWPCPRAQQREIAASTLMPSRHSRRRSSREGTDCSRRRASICGAERERKR